MHKELLKVEKELSEANEILQLEDENAIEGNVAKKCKNDLYQIRQCISNLKNI